MTSTPHSKAMTLRLDHGIHSNLALMCRIMGVSVSDAVRTAVLDYMDEMRKLPDFGARVRAQRDSLAALDLMA